MCGWKPTAQHDDLLRSLANRLSAQRQYSWEQCRAVSAMGCVIEIARVLFGLGVEIDLGVNVLQLRIFMMSHPLSITEQR